MRKHDNSQSHQACELPKVVWHGRRWTVSTTGTAVKSPFLVSILRLLRLVRNRIIPVSSLSAVFTSPVREFPLLSAASHWHALFSARLKEAEARIRARVNELPRKDILLPSRNAIRNSFAFKTAARTFLRCLTPCSWESYSRKNW